MAPGADRTGAPRRAHNTDQGSLPATARRKRLRHNRGGDRRLNGALHIIVLSRAPTDPTTRADRDRKHSEGKTKREVVRCLKRHPARRIWRLLYTTTEVQPTPEDPSL